MQWKKTSIKVRARIIEEKINTLWSTRDIEATTGIPHETVAKVLRDDFTQVCTESEEIAKQIDRNKRLILLWDSYAEELINNKDAKLSEVVWLKKVAWEQNQTMQWKNIWNYWINWANELLRIQAWEVKEEDVYSLYKQTKQ
jgi:hypothetical protein